MTIVTIDNDINNVLAQDSQQITLTKAGLSEAKEIIDKLKENLHPLMPAAGLAAPQIGINKQIFLFSWDRTWQNVIAVINPSFKPISIQKQAKWEACFSGILGKPPYSIAYMPRFNKILVRYFNKDGKKVEQILEEFAARVFQHEYEHLHGIVNVWHPQVETKVFDNKQDLEIFIKRVKQQDKVNYIAPQDIKSLNT